MAAFVFDDLPHDIAANIVSLLSKEGGYKALGPLIRTGRLGRKLAFSPENLAALPLTAFLNNPTLINKDRIQRSFFLRCVEAKNPDACYLEGIRTICQDASFWEGIRILQSVPQPRPLYVTFALGIFLFCVDNKRRARHYINEFEVSVPNFEEMNIYADQFIEYVGEIRRRTEWGLIKWPDTFYDQVPLCAGGPCTMDEVCYTCFHYYVAMKVRQWL